MSLASSEFLLDQGADADAQDNENCTPLHWASQQGHLEVVPVRVLIEWGHRCKRSGPQQLYSKVYSCTPLHGASRDGHLEVVQFLLERGADARASDQGGWTSLQWPSYNGEPEIVRALFKHGVDANTPRQQ